MVKQARLVEKQMYGETVYFASTRSTTGDLVIDEIGHSAKEKGAGVVERLMN